MRGIAPDRAADAPRIHPTAIVEDSVAIGPRTAIWDSVHVRGPATIGRECIVGEKTYIAYGVTIGDAVKINSHAYLCTGVTVEDRVMIAAGVIFTNDRYPRAFSDDGDGLAPSGPTEDTLSTIVRTGATIGAGAVVGPGLEIGMYGMVGMGAVVTRDVPPHGLVVGSPARLMGHVCVCGRPVAGAPAAALIVTRTVPPCAHCGRRYVFVEGHGGPALREVG